jgi:hypothetical protein
MSEATISKHSNMFTYRLLLSEGREGEAWDPCNITIVFLPCSKMSLTLLLYSLAALTFSTSLCDGAVTVL